MHFAQISSPSRTAERESIVRRDEELVAAVRAGSHEAFEAIQKLYSNRLYKRILSITKNHEDSEDALQDAFLRAYLKIDSFEGRSQLSTWLTRIAINSALMCLRRRHRWVEVAFQEKPEPGAESRVHDIRDTAPNPEESYDLKHRYNRVSNAIDRLDAKSRTTLGAWVEHESSMKEIAQTLDVSLPSVKARLHRARKRLIQMTGADIRAPRHPYRISARPPMERKTYTRYA
jgi:RNA polymerase sigma-70 factor, ECF subfamily